MFKDRLKIRLSVNVKVIPRLTKEHEDNLKAVTNGSIVAGSGACRRLRGVRRFPVGIRSWGSDCCFGPLESAAMRLSPASTRRVPTRSGIAVSRSVALMMGAPGVPFLTSTTTTTTCRRAIRSSRATLATATGLHGAGSPGPASQQTPARTECGSGPFGEELTWGISPCRG